MAQSKKLKTTTSTAKPLQEYDVDRFVSFVAHSRYLDLVVKKRLYRKGVCMYTWIVCPRKLKIGNGKSW